MTGILIDNWIAYETENRLNTYNDSNRQGVLSVINEATADSQVAVFNPAFLTSYDYFEYVEVVYQLTVFYRWTAVYANGQVGRSNVSVTTICRTPNINPPSLPPPTFNSFSNFPSTVRYYNNDLSNPIVSISWDIPGVLSTTNYSPALFIPGRANGANDTNRVVRSTTSDFAFASYAYGETLSIFPTVLGFFRNAVKPNYFSLLKGYELDTRTVKNNPVVIPTESKTINIQYYRQNKLEPVPELASIDLMNYECDLVLGESIALPIVDCVLGSLNISDTGVKNILINSPSENGKYPLACYFKEQLPALFNSWNILFDPSNTPPSQLVNGNGILNTKVIRIIGANNNHWNNRPIPTADLNYDATHPMFVINNQRAYDWHIKPQSDGSYGDLVMDSPRIIELHNALNASQYLVETPAIIGTGTIDNPQTPATHKLDWYIKNSAGDKVTAIWKALGGDKFATYIEPTTGEKVDRFSNLGWYIQNIARVLGLRVDEKGYIDSSKEEDLYTRSILNDPQYDKNAYSKNAFGRYGRLTPHLTNSNGLKAFDKVADIPQMIEAVMEHQNRSLGIQQGTEIGVLNSTTGKKDYYPNQLAMLLDIHSKVTEVQLNAKENHNLITVLAHEVRELFSVLGAAISFKSLWTRYGKFMYIGHQSDKGSLITSLTTLKMNVGMLVGNLLVDRPRDTRNPLERIFSKPKK